MSAKLMGLIFELELPLKPKMVMLKYSDHADPDGCNAWPSIKTVSRGCSISERTTFRIVKTLKALEALRQDGQGFGGRTYKPKGQSYRIDLAAARAIGPTQWKDAYEKTLEAERTSANKVAKVPGSEPLPHVAELSEDKRLPHLAEVSEDERLPSETKRLPYEREPLPPSGRQTLLEPSKEPSTESPSGDSSAPGRAPIPTRDLKSQIFGHALDWLAQQTGRPKDKLRPMVGRWCRDHGDGRVLEIMTQAARCGPVEPVAWIERTLKDERDGKRRGTQSDLTAGQAAAAGILGRDLGP